MIHNPSWGPIAPPLPTSKPEQPAIEYVITAGEGRLIAYGVTEQEIHADISLVLEGKNVKFYVSPCTTACVTGA